MSDFQLSEHLDNEKCFVLHRSEIEKRLDPFYYIPSLKELEKKVLDKGAISLRNFVEGISSGATPKTSEKEKYYSDEKKGIPFLRVQNLSPTGFLELDNCKYINVETHNNYLKRSQVQGGDLLVKITGVGRMAVASVAPDGFIGNTNQHMVVIKTNSRETSEIIASYLNTDIGEKLASRRATGGTRPALDYPALLSIPIIFNTKILDIHNKAIKLKQQKEKEAEDLLDSIDDYLLGELGITLPEVDNSLESRMFEVSLSEISGNRFDPLKYYSVYKKKIKAIFDSSYKKTIKPLKNLIISSLSGDWGDDEKKISDFNEYQECLVLRATEFDNKFNIKIDGSRKKYRFIKKEKLLKFNIEENDILIEKSGGSPDQPVGRVVILTKEIIENNVIAYSNFIHKIKIKENLNAVYIFNYLRVIYNQKMTENMQSQTNGIRNLIMKEFLNMPIPIPKINKQNEIATHIQNLRDQAKQLQKEAKEALKNAKLEVEQIILGE